MDLSSAEGVIIVFNDNNVSDVCQRLNLSIVKKEFIDDMEIVYGYTSLFSDHIYVDGKQSNVQIVQKQSEVIAGFPIILSGF